MQSECKVFTFTHSATTISDGIGLMFVMVQGKLSCCGWEDESVALASSLGLHPTLILCIKPALYILHLVIIKRATIFLETERSPFLWLAINFHAVPIKSIARINLNIQK